MIVLYNNKNYTIDDNSTVEDFIKKYNLISDFEYEIVLALIDNKLKELTFKLYDGANIKLLDLKEKDSRNSYMRSLLFIFIVALKNVRPESKCSIEHSLSNGYFCEIKDNLPINKKYVTEIQQEMDKLINSDIKLTRLELDINQAKDLYKQKKDFVKLGLIDYRNEDEKVPVYDLNGEKNYFYGFMVPSTSYVKMYNIRLCSGGIVILGPDIINPNKVSDFKNEPRLLSLYSEVKSWGQTIGIENIVDLNKSIENNTYHDLIRYCEGYHEKKICEMVDIICRDNKKIILIAGPSSSGKTSFAQRLKIQLIANKKLPISISMDNYFIDRDKNPIKENGKRDFESLNALDIERFNEDLDMLISGYEVKLPIYDFITGKRIDDTDTLPTKINDNQPIIIEGIHGLNPALTEAISSAYKFKIYISAITGLNIDEHNKISSTDLRLMRRIIRDNSHRGYSPEETMSMWEEVGEGERKNIFIFQENADAMFNSSLVYEISVIKKYIEPLLKNVKSDSIYHKEAKKLLKFTQYFKSIDDESDIANTSLLREFIGGSKLVH